MLDGDNAMSGQVVNGQCLHPCFAGRWKDNKSGQKKMFRKMLSNNLSFMNVKVGMNARIISYNIQNLFHIFKSFFLDKTYLGSKRNE